MEDYLRYWKLREWLSIDEATSLALGHDPSLTVSNLYGWDGLNRALYEAVSKSDGFTFDCNTVDFQGSNLNSSNTLLKVTAIEEWFRLKKMINVYFNPDKTAEHIKKEAFRPEYQTKLMSIMYETINRYYSENYDPNDRDRAPLQANVFEWLKETYAVTHPEAQAIDKMTRPQNPKSPQGKK